MNDNKDNKAAAEPPLDCLVGRLRAMARHEHDDLSIGDEAADEIDRLRGALIMGASLLEQGCNAEDMAASMWRAAAVPNACGEPGLTEPGKD